MCTDRCVAMMNEFLRNPLFNVMCACMWILSNLLPLATPGPPNALSVDNAEARSILISWEPPVEADSLITFYTIKAHISDIHGGNVVTMNTSTNATWPIIMWLVSFLAPLMSWLLYMAVSQGGVAVSQPPQNGAGSTGFIGTLVPCLYVLPRN